MVIDLDVAPPSSRPIAWQRPLAHRLHAAAVTGSHLFTVGETGIAATFVLSSGAPAAVSSGAVPAGSAPTLRVLDWRVYLLADRTVTALSMPDLRTLWTVPLPLPRTAVRCGGRLCVSGAAGMSAMDPETGRVAWNNAGWTGGEGGLVRAADGHGVLIDPGSGAVRAALGPGLPFGDLLLRAGPEGLDVVEWATGRIRGRLPAATPSGCRHPHRAAAATPEIISPVRRPAVRSRSGDCFQTSPVRPAKHRELPREAAAAPGPGASLGLSPLVTGGVVNGPCPAPGLARKTRSGRDQPPPRAGGSRFRTGRTK